MTTANVAKPGRGVALFNLRPTITITRHERVNKEETLGKDGSLGS